MNDSTPHQLTADDVRHVAKLARLRLTDAQVEMYRSQLGAVLRYVSKISELDVTGVEPLAHPLDLINRMDDDEPVAPMAADDLLRNAPEPGGMEGSFLAVPKVLADEG